MNLGVEGCSVQCVILAALLKESALVRLEKPYSTASEKRNEVTYHEVRASLVVGGSVIRVVLRGVGMSVTRCTRVPLATSSNLAAWHDPAMVVCQIEELGVNKFLT